MDKKQFTNRDKGKMYITVIILCFIVLSLSVALNYYSDRFTTHNKHITYSVTNIKYLITKSHLHLEGYLNGGMKDHKKIDIYLEEALKQVTILLEGGEIRSFQYNPMHSDNKMAALLGETKSQLTEINRFKNGQPQNESYYQELDLRFHHHFEELIQTLDKIDLHVVKKFEMMYSYYTKVKYALYFSIIGLIVFGACLIRRFNKEIEDTAFLSYLDSLTKVQNVKGYKKEFLKLFSIFIRHKKTFSIIMFDIDNFKYINDTYGHRVGDSVLIDISKLISGNIRHKDDCLFRVGGEEFVVLCPDTNVVNAQKVAEKLRTQVATGLTTIKDHQITISIGVTEVQEKDTEDTLYKRVDKYLYYSKHNGKNLTTSDLNAPENNT